MRTNVSPWAQVHDKYVEDGIDPATTRSTSHFKGVCWDKNSQKWRALCEGQRPGRHATEEAAAGAYTRPLLSST
jgi:hypothetical protein